MKRKMKSTDFVSVLVFSIVVSSEAVARKHQSVQPSGTISSSQLNEIFPEYSCEHHTTPEKSVP